MNCVLIVFFLVAFAVAQDDYEGKFDYGFNKEYYPPHYTFEYNVHDPDTGDIKSHKESRKGDKVEGYYMLKENDGTIREVHYTADDKNGFNADVRKTGYPSENHNQYEAHSGESNPQTPNY